MGSIAANEGTLDFDALFRRRFDDVYGFIASLMGDRAMAEEVTAIAFERAFRKRHRFDPGRGSPDSWLFGIARNAALDELRRQRRTVALTPDLPAEAGENPESQVDRRLELQRVRSAMAKLDERRAQLVALRFFAGLRNAEIAVIMKMSETAVSSLLYRALDTLRRACDER